MGEEYIPPQLKNFTIKDSDTWQRLLQQVWGCKPMENYIVINGKKMELTKEQLEQLGVAPKRNNPFDKVGNEGRYYYIGTDSEISATTDEGVPADIEMRETVNYFNDADFL